MPSTSSRKLLVEGDTDKRVIPFLMEANGIEWERSGRPVVYIEPYNGVEELLKPGVVEAELRASGLEILGVMVDANGDASDRWNRIRNLCRDEFDDLPTRFRKVDWRPFTPKPARVLESGSCPTIGFPGCWRTS